MALTLPDNFKNDIQGRDANIYPFVLIDDDGMNIRLSTNAITIGDFFYKPLLLNIPSLKESIDIEKRNYKISSITLDISNYEYEGVRFSDLVGDTSLINMEVQILWGSQSTVSHATAFQVYNGSIRRYTHDDEKVRLVVEDRSQATLHKDLPLPENYLTEDNGHLNVPDKYKNKPIPMVYGHVDKSPCVIKSSPAIEEWGIEEGSVKIQSDMNETISINDLYIFDNTYVFIPPTLSLEGGQSKIFDYSDGMVQFTSSNNIITLASSSGWDSDNVNPISLNKIIAYQEIGKDSMTFKPLQQRSAFWSSTAGFSPTSGSRSWYGSYLRNVGGVPSFYGSLFKESDGDDNDWQGSYYLWGDDANQLIGEEQFYLDIWNESGGQNDKHEMKLVGGVIQTGVFELGSVEESAGILYWKGEIWTGNMSASGTGWGTSAGDRRIYVRLGGDSQDDYDLYDHDIAIGTEPIQAWEQQGGDIPSDAGGWSVINNTNQLLAYCRLPIAARMAVELKLTELTLFNYALIKDMLNQDFYANVNGRSDPSEITEGTEVESWYITEFGYYADAEKITPPTVNGTNVTDPLNISFGIYEAGTFDIHQGYCTDGQYQYFSDSNGWSTQAQCKIEKWNSDFTVKVGILGDIRPTNGDDPVQVINTTIGESVGWTGINAPDSHPILSHCHTEANHIGDCDYYNGYILTGSGRWEGGVGVGMPYPQLVVIEASSMTVVNVANLHAGEDYGDDTNTATSPGHTASAVTTDDANSLWYLSSYTDVNGHNSGYVYADRMAVYDLNTILSPKCEFVGWYNYVDDSGGLSPDGNRIYYVQGLAYAAEHLYVTVNSGNIYVLKPNHDDQTLSIIGYHTVGSGASHQGMNFYTDPNGNLKLGMLRDHTNNGHVNGSTANIYFFPVTTETISAEGELTYIPTYTLNGGLIQKPSDIAYHLMDTELNGGTLSDTENYSGYTSIQESRNEHPFWEFGFTVSKKINSKKLLEEMFASSKSFIRYNSMGEYSFVTLKNYTSYDDHDLQIINDEIISLRYSRTKIEDVVTSVIVEYKKNYARDEYDEVLDALNTDALFVSGNYSPEYYGLELDHSESEKTFSSNYIRDHGTAEKWQDFLLNWYCNQHLLMFVDLPLKYMNIEIGDVVVFDKATDVLPYGIEYTQSGIAVNGQTVYPQFLVYETNKQIDKVSVKLIQTHNLDSANNYIQTLGCNDPDAINFDCASENSDPTYPEEGETRCFDDVTKYDGSCVYEDGGTGTEIYGCMDDNPVYCNYDPNATVEDVCLAYDCFGVCGGDAELDGCGNCYGFNALGEEVEGCFESDGCLCPCTGLMGDLNGDGILNVLDIVSLLNCILNLVGTPDCDDTISLPLGICGDMTGDGNWNVLDIVTLANCVIGTTSCNG